MRYFAQPRKRLRGLLMATCLLAYFRAPQLAQLRTPDHRKHEPVVRVIETSVMLRRHAINPDMSLMLFENKFLHPKYEMPRQKA